MPGADFLINIRANSEQAESAFRKVGAAGQTAGRQVSGSMDGASHNTANLAAQFQDIGVMLAAGQSPLQLAIQQGSQISQVLGPMGAAGAARSLGAAFMALINPVTFITIGAIAGGATLYQWLTSTTEAAGTLEDKMSSLASTVGAYKTTIDALNATPSAFLEQYGENADEARRLLQSQMDVERRMALDAAQAATASINADLGGGVGGAGLAQVQNALMLTVELEDALESLRRANEAGSLEEQTAAQMRVAGLQEAISANADLIDQIGTLAAEMGGEADPAARRLAVALAKLNDADTAQEMVDAYEGLRVAFDDAVGKGEKLTGTGLAISNAINQGWQEMIKMAAIDLAATVFGPAADEAERMAGAISGARISAQGLRGDGGMNINTSLGADALGASANLLKQLENPQGIWERAEWDTNHWRVGWSSDTITTLDANGREQVRTTQQGDTVTQEDADRDLRRRIRLIHQEIIAGIGPEMFGKLPPATIAAITSVGYNYGAAAPAFQGVLDTASGGNLEAIAQRIENLPANRDRRATEAALVRSGATSVPDTVGGELLAREDASTDALVAGSEAALARAAEEQKRENERLAAEAASAIERADSAKKREAEAELERARREAESIRAANYTEAEALEAKRKELDSLVASGALAQSDANEELARYTQELHDSNEQVKAAEALLSSIETPLETYNRKVAEATALQRANKISLVDMNRAIADAKVEYDAAAAAESSRINAAAAAALEGTQEKLNESIGTGRELMGGFIGDLRSGASAMELLGNTADRVADKLINMGLDALFGTAEAPGALAGLGGALFGALGGGGGGSLLNLTGSGGSYGVNIPAIPRAAGGRVFPGGRFRVGENGPEVMQFDRAGSIVPNHKLPSPESAAMAASASGAPIRLELVSRVDRDGNIRPFVERVAGAQIAGSEARQKKALPAMIEKQRRDPRAKGRAF